LLDTLRTQTAVQQSLPQVKTDWNMVGLKCVPVGVTFVTQNVELGDTNKSRCEDPQSDGINIWTCQIEGPRKKAKLKGYLLEKPTLLFETVLADNPFLKIETA
jgi:hypothetical protein